MTEDARATLAELSSAIQDLLGRRLVGLYLFGSLAAGGFIVGRSDLDLFAVVDADLGDADIDELRVMHERFESARPAWQDRVEVAYVSRSVLATFADVPTGTIARVSPGEPMHRRDLEGNLGWLLDWRAVLVASETLAGPPPDRVGPPVSDERFRAAVHAQLRELATTARGHDVAYVPVQQGYIVATVCRGLYSLATGEQTSKEKAVEWAAERDPANADYIRSAFAAYRADVRAPHERLIGFVDRALAGANRES